MSTQRKALVFGGKTGLLGQALVRRLSASGWEVGTTTREDVDFFSSDFFSDLERLVDRHAPDCIFNTVAFTLVDAAEENREGADILNRQLPAALGRIVAASGCRLVHYSTDFVFNGRKESPYIEEDATAPLNVYGKTKLAGEEALKNLALPACAIIRTAWLFGPGRGNFVHTMVTKGKERGTLNVVNDQVGSPTYTPDLAKHSVHLAEAGANGIFHIVNAGQASWYELAQEAIAAAQVDCTVHPIPSEAYPQKAIRPIYSALDCGKLAKVTGITPRPWREALHDYIATEFPQPVSA